MITKTEKLQAAWEVLNSGQLIEEMLIEAGAKGDEIENVTNSLMKESELYLDQIRKERVNSIYQQMILAGVTFEDIEEHQKHLATKPKAKKARKAQGSFVCAVVNGIEVRNRGVIPKLLKDKHGWTSKNDIPEEYWTEEYREFRGKQTNG